MIVYPYIPLIFEVLLNYGLYELYGINLSIDLDNHISGGYFEDGYEPRIFNIPTLLFIFESVSFIVLSSICPLMSI